MENKNLLIDGLNQLNINPDSQMIDRFIEYYNLLIEWNKKMNLTAITDEKEVITKHFLDSVVLVKFMDMNKVSTLFDIGTGAGFPGLPLKILYPHIKLSLLDSVNKKIQFLDEVVKKLSLTDVNCIHGRAEDYAREVNFREGFDLVVSRAVSNLSTLSEYCIPFVNNEGYFVSYKSADYEFEVNDAEHAIEVLGGKIESIKESKVPNADIHRSYILIKKIKNTPNQYPRKAGIPAKKPL